MHCTIISQFSLDLPQFARYLSWFYLLAIMNIPAINIYMWDSNWKSIFRTVGYLKDMGAHAQASNSSMTIHRGRHPAANKTSCFALSLVTGIASLLNVWIGATEH